MIKANITQFEALTGETIDATVDLATEEGMERFIRCLTAIKTMRECADRMERGEID